MLGGLFKPNKELLFYHYLIGKQHLIVIQLIKKYNQIINNRLIETLMCKYHNLYFFKTFEEMETQLDDLITFTDDDYIVVIG